MTDDDSPDDGIDRRTVIKSLPAAGTVSLAGCGFNPLGGGQPTGTRDQDSGTTPSGAAGVVRDVFGAPVPHAGVTVFARDGRTFERVAATDADERGRYEFPELAGETATYENGDGDADVVLFASLNAWFGAARVGAGEFFPSDASTDVEIDAQQILAPTATEVGSVPERHRTRWATAAVWRRVVDVAADCGRSTQEIGIEVTGMPPTGEQYGTRPGDGSISLEIPEAVDVDYGQARRGKAGQPMFRPEWTDYLATTDSRAYAASLRDAQEFSFPVRPLLADLAYDRYTLADENAITDGRQAREAMADFAIALVGFTPGPVGYIASALGYVDSYLLKESPEKLPTSPTDGLFVGGGTASKPDPNAVDLVPTSWVGIPFSVTKVTTVEFPDATPRSFVARGSWHLGEPYGPEADTLEDAVIDDIVSTSAARLEQEFTVDPTHVTPRGRDKCGTPATPTPTPTETPSPTPATPTPTPTPTGTPTPDFYDDFEDGDLQDPGWNTLTSDGTSSVGVVDRSSPDGGSRCLRLLDGPEGDDVIGPAAAKTDRLLDVLDPWVADGLFYATSIGGENATSQVWVSMYHFDEAQLQFTLGSSLYGDEPLALEGPGATTRVQAPGLDAGTWYRWELRHDGDGAFVGRRWPASGARSEGSTVRVDAAPIDGGSYLRLAVYGGDPKTAVDHAYVRWRRTGGDG